MKKLIAPSWDDYHIIDSGEGKKLERFGEITLIRPQQGANWSRTLAGQWQDRSQGEFKETQSLKGDWEIHDEIPDKWYLNYPLGDRNIHFTLKLTQFKHVGVFPEQSINWEYLYEKCHNESRVLNLFAHTGGASQAAALAGAQVTHIDSVYSMVGWARENGEKAGLSSVKWICEDSVTFVEKEIRRGNFYDFIILDPPTYGQSGKKRAWKIERDLKPLLKKVKKLINPRGGEIILNCYSPRIELRNLKEILGSLFTEESTDIGELFLSDDYDNKMACGFLVKIKIEG